MSSDSDLVWSSDPSLRAKLPAGGAMSGARKRSPQPQASGSPERRHLPKGPCVSLETAGRKGRGVTLVTGLPLAPDPLETLGKSLRQACGTGGTTKDGVIEIQGDHRDKVVAALAKAGITARRL